MMNKNSFVWMMLILIVGVTLGVYSTYFHQVRAFPEQRSASVGTLECWVYTDTWGPLLDRFQTEHPEIGLHVRVFRSYTDLYEELMNAISAKTAPDVVELNNAYGLAELLGLTELLGQDVLAPAQTYLTPEDEASIGETFRSAFMSGNSLWAAPAGVSLPIMFYNRDMVQRGGLEQSLGFPDLSSFTASVRTWLSGQPDESGLPGSLHALAVDRSFPFLFTSMWESRKPEDRKARLQELLGEWRGLAVEPGVMKPLQHELALSDFISGKTMFYAATSERRAWLQRYIGGKFDYGLLPLPETNGQTVLPQVTAFAVFSMNDRVKPAGELVRYLISPEVQSDHLGTTGYLPVRGELAGQPNGDSVLTGLYAPLWEKKSPGPSQPGAYGLFRWKVLEEELQRLEFGTEQDVVRAADKLLPLMP
ncbi:extracellular solute-binding protein [Paenibacillus filicis]|uniref:Extracellular solute-binding protein n=1 Tax=Paenibacillus filicis TaxID=669464 RepID=A0ABU9DPH1_9BACL